MPLKPSNILSTRCCVAYPTATHAVWPTLLLLVASNSPEQHQEHLHQVLQRLSEHGIIINPSKCEFGVTELDFLGHRVSSQGIQPRPERVKAVKEFPTPTSWRKLREFLGLVNFYHHFIPKCASILGPLNSLFWPLRQAKTTSSIGVRRP